MLLETAASGLFGWLEGCVLWVALRYAFMFVWVIYFVHLQWATPLDADSRTESVGCKASQKRNQLKTTHFLHSLRSLIAS